MSNSSNDSEWNKNDEKIDFISDIPSLESFIKMKTSL